MTDAETKTVLWEAEFNPKVRTYWLLSGAMVLFLSIVGIPLLIIWFAIGWRITEIYLERMRCVLTERTLEFGKGMLVRVEKTVPLDKITDLGLVHGPIMRYLGLQALSVETAGQSSQGALVRLVGIRDTEAFREAVLAQRDRMVAAGRDSGSLPPASETNASGLSGGDALPVLEEIRDTLRRIEQNLGDD